jgi:aminoglycoside 2''-phosphotransferase
MMNDSLEPYLSRIRDIQPGVPIESAVLNDEGLVNVVVIVNRETVFRFAKNEYGVKALEAELRVLRAIRSHISLAVPAPFYTRREVIAYPFLKGETLTRTILASLAGLERQVVTNQLANFLKELWNIAIDETLPATLAPVRYADWIAIHRSVEEKVYPLLMKHQRAWAEQLFDDILADENNFNYTPKLIHGDLGCYHILFDSSLKCLSSIIDFGTAGVGDPANDLALLIQYYGEPFVSRMQAVYPEIDIYMKRARFYAQAIELEWVLNGLNSGETFWYTAHVGNGRDLLG